MDNAVCRRLSNLKIKPTNMKETCHDHRTRIARHRRDIRACQRHSRGAAQPLLASADRLRRPEFATVGFHELVSNGMVTRTLWIPSVRRKVGERSSARRPMVRCKSPSAGGCYNGIRSRQRVDALSLVVRSLLDGPDAHRRHLRGACPGVALCRRRRIVSGRRGRIRPARGRPRISRLSAQARPIFRPADRGVRRDHRRGDLVDHRAKLAVGHGDAHPHVRVRLGHRMGLLRNRTDRGLHLPLLLGSAGREDARRHRLDLRRWPHGSASC